MLSGAKTRSVAWVLGALSDSADVRPASWSRGDQQWCPVWEGWDCPVRLIKEVQEWAMKGIGVLSHGEGATMGVSGLHQSSGPPKGRTATQISKEE